MYFHSGKLRRGLHLKTIRKQNNSIQINDWIVFSTIWYELMTCSFPWKNIHPDEIVWRVGNGFKSPMTHVITALDIKVLLCLICFDNNYV